MFYQIKEICNSPVTLIGYKIVFTVTVGNAVGTSKRESARSFVHPHRVFGGSTGRAFGLRFT